MMDLPTRLGPQLKPRKLGHMSVSSNETQDVHVPASSVSSSSALTLDRLQDSDRKPHVGSKSKAAPSASSFLTLKADLAERQARTGGREAADKSSNRLPSHLLPSRARTGRSTKSRSQSDNSKRVTSSWSSTPSAQLEAARLALERKAKAYELLKRGKEGGVDEDSFRSGVVDWDLKRMQEEQGSESDEGGSASESDRETRGPREDPLIEYKDELGRTRMMRRSEVPRDWLREQERKEREGDEEEVYDDAIYAPQTDFPVYQRSPRSKPISLSGADQAKHFDASYEVRNRGAAFYAFDKDEEVRARQMKELEEERRKTEMRRVQDELGDGDARAAVGGEDGLLGKVEIDKDEERRQKRRLEVERKRKEIEAKRKRTRAD